MAKSMRTAFIRVTTENITKDNGVVYYTKLDIERTLKDWDSKASKGIEYWFVEHEADSEIDKAHFHIVLRFTGGPIPFDQVKSRFPYGNIQSAKNVRNAVQYLVHLNDPSKIQYKWSDVIHNCDDINKYKVQSVASQEVTIVDIIGKIDKGIIKEYNQFELIPSIIWSKHKTRIENALTHYRERICMDKSREINVIFFSGDTGTGKTTFAKKFCTMSGLSSCVSSSTNDPMQDYKGEDVLILDDLRDDAYSFTDLLKILDNHTKSTVRSRYHNKAFIGDVIIITSYKPLDQWYTNVPMDALKQLYRRIGQTYEFTKDLITVKTFDESSMTYTFTATAPNMITMEFEKKKEKSLEMLKAMGVEFSTEVLDTIANAKESDFVQVNLDDDNPFDFGGK